MTQDLPPDARQRRNVRTLLVVGAVVLVTIVALVGWNLNRSEPAPWGLVEVEGSEVEVEYVGGECDWDAFLEVDETPDEVVLTVRVVGWSLSCSDVGVPRRLRTTLESPLGDRTLVDGACREARYAQQLACGEG